MRRPQHLSSPFNMPSDPGARNHVAGPSVEARIAALEEALRQLSGSAGGGVSDHGALTGLGDDDHPHYALVAGDTYTGTHAFAGATAVTVPTAASAANPMRRDQVVGVYAPLAGGAYSGSHDFTGATVTVPTGTAGTGGSAAASQGYVETATGNASVDRPMGHVVRTSAQALAASTWTAVQFSSEITDTDNVWSSGASTRLTATTAGNYVVTAHAGIDNTGATATHAARLVHKNSAGTVQAYYATEARSGSVDVDGPSISKVLALAAGDYIELQLLAGIATNTAVFSNTHHAALSMAWMGGTGAAWGNAGAELVKNADQNIPTGTVTAVTWPAETFDIDGMHSTSVNTERFTCVTPGTYQFSGGLFFASNATGYRAVKYGVNGGGSRYVCGVQANASGGTITPFAFAVQLNAGDYVTIYAEQNSGSTIAIGSGSNTFASAVRVGYQTNPSSPPAVSVYNPDYAGSVSIATSTERTLDWNSEEYDTHGFHAAGSPGIIVPGGCGGIYHFDAQAYFGSINAVHSAYVAVYVYNESSVLQRSFYGTNNVQSASIASTALVSGDVVLEDGWIINVAVFQNSGSAQNLVATTGRTRFSMHRVGDAS